MGKYGDEHYHYSERTYRLNLIFWGLLFKRYCRLRVVGVENVPRHGPAVVASNHVSMLDPFLVGYAMQTEHPIAFMGKLELFKIPPVKFLLERLGSFPVDRSRKDAASLRTALNILNEGEILGMFPEGTRSSSGELDELRTGAIRLALRTKAPLIPAGIYGTDKSLPRGHKFPRPTKIAVAYGPPLRLEQFYDRRATPDETAQISEQLKTAMQDQIDRAAAAWQVKRPVSAAQERA